VARAGVDLLEAHEYFGEVVLEGGLMDNNKVNPWMISTVVLALVVGFLIGCEVQSPRQQAGAGAGDYVYFDIDRERDPQFWRINPRTQGLEILRLMDARAVRADVIGGGLPTGKNQIIGYVTDYYWDPLADGKLIENPRKKD